MSGLSRLKTMTAELKEKQKAVYGTIAALCDEMSFVESDRFLRSSDAADGDGVVTGFASIDGIGAGIFVTNHDVRKGSIGRKGAEKIVKLIDNALKTGSPVIGVLDTEGAKIYEGIEALEGYSKIIKSISLAYGEIPVIMVVKNFNYGLTSYLSGICDACIAYDKSSMASSSPLILSAKAGVDASKVGNAEIHSSQTGLYSMVVKNDKELKTAVSGILSSLLADVVPSKDDGNRTSKILKNGSKAADIIKEVFDNGSFIELKKNFAPSVKTGYARLNGISVAVVATDGSIDDGRFDSQACIKIFELLSSAGSFGLPVINIVDSCGAKVDLTEENGGLLRETANLFYIYSTLEVPKIALITGSAIGAGYTAFAAKGSVDYCLSWPDAKISAIESKAAAELIYADEIKSAKNKDAAVKKLAESYDEENTIAAVVSKDGYIDNIVEPQFSRQYLIAALQTFLSK